MVHIVFDPSIAQYDEYVQYGSGLEKDNFDYFRGSSPFQRGYGIQRGAGVGDVFRGLWRFFLPILRRVGTTVGSEALSTGQRVLERVGNEGVPFKEALVSEGKRGIDTVLDKGGLPKQFGSGKRNFFRIPPTNVSVSSSKVFELLPSNPLTDTPYHFKLHSSQNYIDLSKCYLLTEFRIRKENNNGQLVDLTVDDADIAPIQMIGQTFIRNIKMSINGREIFNANSLMAYKTYFSHELSYSTTAKDSHLNAAGYYRDMGDALEIGNGFIARRNLFAGSNVAQFIAKIDTDLFNQPLYLINFCELDIEILPNDNAFVLIAPSGGRYHFEVVGLKMYVKKVSLMDGLALDIAQKLEVKPVRYAVRKTMMKSMFISPGRYEFTANMFMDQIPRRVTMGLVANTDYVGTLLRSPFNFQPFNVREISITANGRPYPQAPYDLDYSNGKYVRPFNDMNEAVGFANSTESNGITFAQYGKTHCIYVFNLTNSGDDQAALFDLIKNGTTAVSIKFNQPVPAGGIMLVVMGECDSLVILSLILFFLRISLPCVSSTLREQQQQRQPENSYSAYLKNLTLTRQQHEPEYTYTEYLRRLSLSKRSTTIPITTTPKTPPKSDKLIDEHVSAVLPPLIQLCKDKPEESSIFHQAVCWALFALYLMLIISLVLHQLCSIFWLKNGQLTNHKNFERKSSDRASVSGLLRQ
ncbi:hypothetical protein niasHT_032814 [Heterodera trifolii]|uniref:Uncharacterized protein n=1 Tax=Heterodera trifolii TaxID=157864 RepID=A0ABD2IQM9_9BILA